MVAFDATVNYETFFFGSQLGGLRWPIGWLVFPKSGCEFRERGSAWRDFLDRERQCAVTDAQERV